jgi:hypothetical protein
MGSGLTLPFLGKAEFVGTADESAAGFQIFAIAGGVAISGTSIAPGLETANFPCVGVLGVSIELPAIPGLVGVRSYGVHGKSTIGDGVHGESQTGTGVWGESQSASGVHAESKSGDAVVGHSNTGLGVSGTSDSGIGVFGKGGSLAGRFEGNVQVTGTISTDTDLFVAKNISVVGDVLLANKDVAERFAVDSALSCEPGMVMVLQDNGVLAPSSKAYDKRVVGVLSGAGALRPAITLGAIENADSTASIALVGTAYCWIDAESGSVDVGDLLTSSSIAGHAMKAVDPIRSFGAVIGKALAPLSQGRALVPMLIALQ